MKKNIYVAALGAVGFLGFAVSSHAQGQVDFSNYYSTPYYPVVYSDGANAGSEVTVTMGYSLDSGATWTLIPSSATALNLTGNSIGSSGAAGPFTGWFDGGVVQIPGYTGGAVGIEIVATSTLPNTGTGTLKWTEPSLSISPSPAGNFTAMPGNVIIPVTPVPEPSTLALAGLSGFGMLMAFRRKKA